MMKNLKNLMIMALAASTVVACNNDELPTGYTLRLQLGHVMQKTSHIQIDKAFAVVTEVELEKENEEFDIEVDVEGSFRFDLLTGQSTPSFPIAEVPEGLYHELEFDLGKEDNDTALYVELTYTDSSGTDHDAVVAITHKVEFEIEDEVNGIQVDASTINALSVTLGLQQILEGLDWSNAQWVNGVLLVDRNNNTQMYNAIVSALNIEIELHDDDDD